MPSRKSMKKEEGRGYLASEAAHNTWVFGIGWVVVAACSVMFLPPNFSRAETPICGSEVSPFILEQAKASVVKIGLTDANGGFVRGTGFVWDTAGHIITNSHVATAGNNLTIELSTGKKIPATVVADFPEFDIAILFSDKTGLTPVQVSDNKAVPGTEVFTFGNSKENKFYVSGGIVLEVERNVILMPGVPLTGLMKTDFVVRAGNSGSPLFNCGGRVVGVISAVGAGADRSALQNSYAIPISDISNSIRSLSDTKCGVNEVATLVDISTISGMGLAMDSEKQVFIKSITAGSAADKAGIRVSDKLTHINSISVFDNAIAESLMAKGGVGGELEISVIRDGAKLDIKLTKSGNQLSCINLEY